MTNLEHSSVIPESQQVAYTVDPEHGGIRFTVMLAFLVQLPIWYFIIDYFISSNGLNLLAIIGTILITYGLTQLLEKYLKQHWKSGRFVQVDDEHIQIIRKNKIEEDIDGSQQVNVLTWRFEIRKNTRVPKGWYMIAIALEQEGRYLPVYTFISPDDFNKLLSKRAFTLLRKEKEWSSPQGDRDLRMAGEQKRLHGAEKQRWFFGAEMTLDDFQHFWTLLEERFPRWMVKTT